jgi:predicted MPP superfamily phosphohydrolase
MHGIYKYDGTYLHVSPGTGTWGPPMRLGSRCEITVITLKSGK